MHQTPIPTGQEIEYIAIAMAAGDGIVWARADKPTADAYRRRAYACLMRLGMHPDLIGQVHLIRTVRNTVTQIRDAAQEMEPWVKTTKADSAIAALYAAATSIEMIGTILDGEEPGEPTEEGEF